MQYSSRRFKNQKFDYEMNCVELESVQYVKYVGVGITSSLKSSQKRKDAAGKANRMLGSINTNFSFGNKDMILPLFATLVRSSCNAVYF